MVGIELDWDGNLQFYVLDKKNLVFIDEELFWMFGKIYVDKLFLKRFGLEIKIFFGMSEIEFEVINFDNGIKVRKCFLFDI